MSWRDPIDQYEGNILRDERVKGGDVMPTEKQRSAQQLIESFLVFGHM